MPSLSALEIHISSVVGNGDCGPPQKIGTAISSSCLDSTVQVQQKQ